MYEVLKAKDLETLLGPHEFHIVLIRYTELLAGKFSISKNLYIMKDD